MAARSSKSDKAFCRCNKLGFCRNFLCVKSNCYCKGCLLSCLGKCCNIERNKGKSGLPQPHDSSQILLVLNDDTTPSVPLPSSDLGQTLVPDSCQVAPPSLTFPSIHIPSLLSFQSAAPPDFV